MAKQNHGIVQDERGQDQPASKKAAHRSEPTVPKDAYELDPRDVRDGVHEPINDEGKLQPDQVPRNVHGLVRESHHLISGSSITACHSAACTDDRVEGWGSSSQRQIGDAKSAMGFASHTSDPPNAPPEERRNR
jgi:hypothetical protein